ncbi:MAG: thioredoxin [Phycisphaerae bacterium]|nr:thioredoxin [Phycisphaerae bacterium]
MAGKHTQTFDESNFDAEVLQADIPVLVDFWAPWCGPCHMVGPALDELAAEYQGKIKVGKVNVDEAAALAGKYGIQSIPMVFLFENGRPVEQMLGAKHKRDYKAAVDARLGGEG